MSIIKDSITKPVVVIVGILLVFIAGFIALSALPFQLTPNVAKPIISVGTSWPGSSPYDVEKEIIEKQEEVLKSVENLASMESTSRNGGGTVVLEFKLGTDMRETLLKVSNKLDEVSSYPDDVNRPVLRLSGDRLDPVVWMQIGFIDEKRTGIAKFRTFFLQDISQDFERIDGVSEVFFPTGVSEEVHIVLDNAKLASFRISLSDIMGVVDSSNTNISAGIMYYESKAYRIRTINEFKSVEDIENIILRSDGVNKVLLKDVATVALGHEKPVNYSFYKGKESLVVGIRPNIGKNIVELTDDVEKVFNILNSTKMKDNGLQMRWIMDGRRYIIDAISLVKQNILLGAILAGLVLYGFLRSFTSTLVVAIAMPISIVGTFVVMQFLGRSLNVISMAGISFAVGMLVDSAIVVLENIDRHRKMGKSLLDSAFIGTQEVKSAIIASTLTTVMIFIPVLYMQDVSGQLFRDIAITASSAVLISMFVSLLIIPMLSYQLLKRFGSIELEDKDDKLIRFGNRVTNSIMKIVVFCLQSAKTRFITIFTFIGFSVVFSYFMFPPMEYLPQGNQNFIRNTIIVPPGISFDERKKIGLEIFQRVDSLIAKDENISQENKVAQIKDFWYVGSESFFFAGATSVDKARANEIVPLLRNAMLGIPGVRVITQQPGVFENAGGLARSVDVDVSGKELPIILDDAILFNSAILEALPKGSQIRALPSLQMTFPEINFIPNKEILNSVGSNIGEFGAMIDVIMDGRKVSEYKQEGKGNIDIRLKSQDVDIKTPEDIYYATMATKSGEVMPIASLSNLERGYGVNEIRHFEKDRTITLRVIPVESISIEEATQIVENLATKMNFNKDTKISISGAAKELKDTRQTFILNFMLVVLITYLLMVALYSDFVYPFIIILTVPFAVAGGIIGIWLVNIFVAPQTLDILTMLGFLILVGIVVNNAILIVYQALDNARIAKMYYLDAVLDAVKTRIKPIAMSTITTLLGMLPLVLLPGAGSEVYRGLGAVILGGLAFSTLLTLLVIPCLLAFVIKKESV